MIAFFLLASLLGQTPATPDLDASPKAGGERLLVLGIESDVITVNQRKLLNGSLATAAKNLQGITVFTAEDLAQMMDLEA